MVLRFAAAANFCGSGDYQADEWWKHVKKMCFCGFSHETGNSAEYPGSMVIQSDFTGLDILKLFKLHNL